ncbi:hypothetical protein EV283_2169 [Sphingomonas sp. BK036]|nr:hypothetical protein EV283_2169 [Sphingomonas sp. BK036]
MFCGCYATSWLPWHVNRRKWPFVQTLLHGSHASLTLPFSRLDFDL